MFYLRVITKDIFNQSSKVSFKYVHSENIDTCSSFSEQSFSFSNISVHKSKKLF